MSRPDYLAEVIRRNNVAARLGPKRIILAGLQQNALVAFEKYFSPSITIVIQSPSEIPGKLEAFKRFEFDGEISCTPEEIAHGLLLAKMLRMKLTVDASASSLKEEFRKFLPRSEHLLVVENSNDFAPIISANYAFSVKAELKLIPPMKREDVTKIYDELLDRRVFETTGRGMRAERNLKERARKYKVYVTPSNLEFITFVTHGVPYGYFLSDVPSTHLFSYPDLGVNIFGGIYYSSTVKATRSAIVVDPGHFEHSESDSIIQNLRNSKVVVKSLRDDDATVYNVKNHIQYYPYDLLYICSHAGEMGGKRLRIRFSDGRGQVHIFVMDYAVAYAPTGVGTGDNEIVEVSEFRRPVELDGVDWSHEQGKRRIGAGDLLKDFTDIPSTKWEILESTDIPYVKDCVALRLSDHYCLIFFNELGHFGYPLVINNACVSFYEFSRLFVFAGARGYIGTLARVPNAVAKAVGGHLFSNLAETKPLPVILWEAQRQVCSDPRQRTYVHVGCHFSNIVGPVQDMSSYLKSCLRQGIEEWTTKLQDNGIDAYAKSNIEKAIKFLTDQCQGAGFGVSQ